MVPVVADSIRRALNASPTMDRWLLNTFTIWELGLILIAACATIAFGANALVHPFIHRVEQRTVSTAFGIVTGLFSFVLAFLIGQLYFQFTSTAGDVRNEATQLAQLVRVSAYLGRTEGQTTNRLALAYAAEVEGPEWRLLRDGKASPEAWRLVDQMYAELSHYKPRTPAESVFYGQALSRLEDLVSARRARLADANVSAPGAIEVMLGLGAILALLTTLNFKPADDRLQLVVIGAASTLVGLALLVALSLDYPFSGDVAVSKQPFTQITRAQLEPR
jgi:hypothetical protein